MKNFFLLAAVTLMVIVSCAKQEPVKFPQGAWNMVQVQRVTNGKSEITFPTDANRGKLTQVKMWSEKNWMFYGKSDRDTVIVDLYGGGTYTLEGTNYEENIYIHHAKRYENLINRNMTMELVNDTLVMTYHPIDEINNELVDSIIVYQKYIPLK